MKLLAEISEGSLGLGDYEKLSTDYRLRKSSRAILFNQQGEIAIQYLENYKYHKLPGGGIDEGESAEVTLKREILEEVGCNCEILDEIGVTIEYINESKLLQVSYCYKTKVVGEIGQPVLEEAEIEEGQITLWLKPEEALARIKNDKPEITRGHFILKREIAFLEEFLGRNQV